MMTHLQGPIESEIEQQGVALAVIVMVTSSDLLESEIEGSQLGLPAAIVASQESVQMSTSTTSPGLRNLLPN